MGSQEAFDPYAALLSPAQKARMKAKAARWRRAQRKRDLFTPELLAAEETRLQAEIDAWEGARDEAT